MNAAAAAASTHAAVSAAVRRGGAGGRTGSGARPMAYDSYSTCSSGEFSVTGPPIDDNDSAPATDSFGALASAAAAAATGGAEVTMHNRYPDDTKMAANQLPVATSDDQSSPHLSMGTVVASVVDGAGDGSGGSGADSALNSPKEVVLQASSLKIESETS
jgi:hypothetical protein